VTISHSPHSRPLQQPNSIRRSLGQICLCPLCSAAPLLRAFGRPTKRHSPNRIDYLQPNRRRPRGTPLPCLPVTRDHHALSPFFSQLSQTPYRNSFACKDFQKRHGGGGSAARPADRRPPSAATQLRRQIHSHHCLTHSFRHHGVGGRRRASYASIASYASSTSSASLTLRFACHPQCKRATIHDAAREAQP
jgi:hypothetical protein